MSECYWVTKLRVLFLSKAFSLLLRTISLTRFLIVLLFVIFNVGMRYGMNQLTPGYKNYPAYSNLGKMECVTCFNTSNTALDSAIDQHLIENRACFGINTGRINFKLPSSKILVFIKYLRGCHYFCG